MNSGGRPGGRRLVMGVRRHRVNPGLAPRVAAQNSLNREPASAPRTVGGNGFLGVTGAARVKAAAAGGHQGDDHQLIGADRGQQQCLENSRHRLLLVLFPVSLRAVFITRDRRRVFLTPFPGPRLAPGTLVLTSPGGQSRQSRGRFRRVRAEPDWPPPEDAVWPCSAAPRCRPCG